MRRCSASSEGVGARPFFCASSPTAALSDRCSSCSRRGTRTDQPWSRKCRLISPVIVGTANDRNSTPRVGSKRSIAAISPSVPTCSRSSKGSPRLLNRRGGGRPRGGGGRPGERALLDEDPAQPFPPRVVLLEGGQLGEERRGAFGAPAVVRHRR